MDLQTILSAYELGTLLKSAPIHGGSLHKTLHVMTDQGEFAIKQLNQNLEQFQYLAITETIANAAKETGFPARTALQHNNNVIFRHEQDAYLVYPYINGHTIASQSLNAEHIKKIAVTSARLHQLNLQVNNAPAFKPFTINPKEWQEHSGGFEHLLKDRIAQFIEIQDRHQQAFERLKQHTLISHRDFTPSNILWQEDESLMVIDWELAGFINPELEMLSNAIDVALTDNHLKTKNIFYYLDAYKSMIKTLKEDPIDLIYGCLGSWVFWILFCVKHHNHTFKPIDTEKMIRKSYRVIDFLLEHAEPIAKILLN